MTEREYNKSLSGNIIFYRSCLNLPKNITFGVEIEYENIVTDTVSELLKDRNDYCGDIEGWLNHSEIDITNLSIIQDTVW
jgi:hypothetical protein